jgi:antitoxin (DNA-binding transcriptional repressor) of toxin-antitoxin stability system
MPRFNSALVKQAARGGPVRITHRGKTVAQITTIARSRKPIDIAALGELTASKSRQLVPARNSMCEARDEERY